VVGNPLRGIVCRCEWQNAIQYRQERRVDPDETLKEMREIAMRMEEAPESFTPKSLFSAFERLAELSSSLDAWLSRGGYLPKEWAR
jgi:hypothetical protein